MGNTTICKTVQSREEFFIQFSDEEMSLLGISPGDRFEIIPGEGRTLTLKKFVPLDVDLSEFDKDTLCRLIHLSVEKQQPVDEIIRTCLAEAVGKGNSGDDIDP